MDEDPVDELSMSLFGDDRLPSEDASQLTESQWQALSDPRVLLEFLRNRISNRQLNLFSIACCRRAWNLLAAPSRALIEATERFVDGFLSKWQLDQAYQAAVSTEIELMRHRMDLTEGGGTSSPNGHETALAHRRLAAASAVTYGQPSSSFIGHYTENTPNRDNGMMAMISQITVAISGRVSDPAEFALQCDLLRDITGNPFRPVVLDPAWQTDAVVPLAQAIYAGAFHQMPVLADALEGAGCTEAAILEHCRGPGPHVQGCWVLDLLLAGRFPVPCAPSAFVEFLPVEKRKEEFPIDRNELCYRCHFRCSVCGPRFILLYSQDGVPPRPVRGCVFCETGNPTITVDRHEPFGEAEWLAGDDLEAMCDWVDDHFLPKSQGQQAVLRKCRLFACRVCRFLWPAITHPDSQAAVNVAETFAERLTTQTELKGAFRKANAAAWAMESILNPAWAPAWAANNAAAVDSPYAQSSAHQFLAHVRQSRLDIAQPERLLVEWLWDIFGDPFRPTSGDPAWQSDGVPREARDSVVLLAQRIYDNGAFDLMPVLADALEDAGCHDPGILSHCRGGGLHARGCFVLDLILGKG